MSTNNIEIEILRRKTYGSHCLINAFGNVTFDIYFSEKYPMKRSKYSQLPTSTP